MKRLAGLTVLALAVSTVSGCSWLTGDDGYFRDRSSDYLKSRQAPPLKVPQGTSTRPTDELLPIPYNVPLDPSQAVFEPPRPRSMSVAAERSDFSMQRSGEQRWLVAQRAPAELWPLIAQFFARSNLPLADERAGSELMTGWVAASSLPAGIYRDLKDADEKEVAFRLRLEPGVQRNTSEIFLLSNQRELGSSDTPEWPKESEEPKLDASLLEQLQISLAATAERGSSVSLLSGRTFDAPGQILKRQDAVGNPQLVLSTDMDRAWSSVGRALRYAGIMVEDMDRSLGLYYINLAEKAEKPDEAPGLLDGLMGKPDAEEVEARAERYQVHLSDAGDRVTVSVEKSLDTSAPASVARRVLDSIQQQLDSAGR